MNKTELITAMAEASGLTKKDCDTALNAFVDTLQTALKSAAGLWHLRGEGARRPHRQESRHRSHH